MVAGFTSWHDIGPLFLYMVAVCLLISIITWFLHKKIKVPTRGGRGKTMTGGSVIKYFTTFIFICIITAGSLGIILGGGGFGIPAR